MVFIDETARVYKNWNDYLEQNVLPKGTMVAPSKGFYTFNSQDVNLEVRPTPASSPLTSVLETGDTISTVSGFCSVGISIAGLCLLPIAAPVIAAAVAPVMAVASGVGLASAGYSAARAGSHLVDRSSHEQSISLSDRQARGYWHNVIGGVIGLGASGATRVLTTAAKAGTEVSLVTALAVNGMNISSIVLSGSEIANGILDLILKLDDGEEITTMDLLQLAASFVLFTHSVQNFELASKIVTDTQNNTIKSYREGLSNRQRRMFDKMTKETTRIQGADKGRMDVIRSVNEIPSKQYLNDLHKINRQLNQQNVRPSFGGAEKPVMLNNELKVDTQVLRNSVQHSKGPDILSKVKQPIPTSHQNSDTRNIFNKSGFTSIPNRLVVTENSSNSNDFPIFDPIGELKKISVPLASGAVLLFAELGTSLFTHVNNPGTLEKGVKALASTYTDDIFHFIIKLSIHFIENSLESIEDEVGIKMPRELVILKVKEIISQYDNHCLQLLKDRQLEIMKKLTCFFKSDEAKECARNAPGSNYKAARFIFTNLNSSNDSLEALMTADIVLACGAVVPLVDFGSNFLEHIINAASFQDVALDMANAFPEATFRFMFGLTQQFIESELDNIHAVIKTHIATETILFRILSHCLKNYANLDDEFLTYKSAEILRVLKSYFLSINPNNIREELTKCPDCNGYYAKLW